MYLTSGELKTQECANTHVTPATTEHFLAGLGSGQSIGMSGHGAGGIFGPHCIQSFTIVITTNFIGGSPRSWQFNPFWLNVINIDRIRVELTGFFGHNEGSIVKEGEWDVMKAFLRVVLIQQISRLKIQRGRMEKTLCAALLTAKTHYISERSISAAGGCCDVYSTRL